MRPASYNWFSPVAAHLSCIAHSTGSRVSTVNARSPPFEKRVASIENGQFFACLCTCIKEARHLVMSLNLIMNNPPKAHLRTVINRPIDRALKVSTSRKARCQQDYSRYHRAGTFQYTANGMRKGVGEKRVFKRPILDGVAHGSVAITAKADHRVGRGVGRGSDGPPPSPANGGLSSVY